MTPLTLLKKLPVEEKEKILLLGTYYYLPKLEARLARAKEKVAFFEEKYGKIFAAFEKAGFKKDADYKTHEDWVEWSYWDNIKREYPSYLSILKKLTNFNDRGI